MISFKFLSLNHDPAYNQEAKTNISPRRENNPKIQAENQNKSKLKTNEKKKIDMIVKIT